MRYETDHPHNQQVIHRFANGFGASVVIGPFTYGGPEGYYELAVLHHPGEGQEFHLDYSTPITDDVVGWLTTDAVQTLLDRIAELPPKKREDCDACRVM